MNTPPPNGNGNVKGSIDFDFPISQELQDQGISGFRIKDQNAILTLVGDRQNKINPNDHMVLFPFYPKNYSRSIDKLKNSLESRQVDNRLITFLCLKITELLLEYVLDNKTGRVTKRSKDEQESWNEMQFIIDNIRRLRKQYKDIPLSVWEEERQKRFNNLRNVVREKMPQAWESIELVLTVKGIRHIRDITLPVIVITIGDPGTWKTLGIGLVRKWPDVLYKDKISPKSWVSHAAKDDEKELESIDLIRQMKDKMFAIPELATIFMQKEDILVDTLSTLVRLADGEGYLGHSGLWGDRGIEGLLMFTMIGAIVQVPPSVYKILSALGPKIYFYTPEFKEATEDDIFNGITGEGHESKKAAIKEALFSYLTWLEVNPELIDLDQKIGAEEEEEVLIDEDEQDEKDPDKKVAPKMRRLAIDWNKDADDIDTIRMISKLAVLLSKVRANVVSYQSKVLTHLNGTANTDGNGNDGKRDNNNDRNTNAAGYVYEYGHSKPIVERPERAGQILYNLARAHAYEVHGRNHITNEDLPIIIKIVLSAANRDRIAVIKALLNGKEDASGLIYNELGTTRKVDMTYVVTEAQLVNSTQISRSSIQRTIEELKPLGLVDVFKTKNESHKNAIVLKEKFNWVYDQEFQDLLKICYPDTVK